MAPFAGADGAAGGGGALVTERGASFGYNNLVVDMRAFPMLRALLLLACLAVSGLASAQTGSAAAPAPQGPRAVATASGRSVGGNTGGTAAPGRAFDGGQADKCAIIYLLKSSVLSTDE